MTAASPPRPSSRTRPRSATPWARPLGTIIVGLLILGVSAAFARRAADAGPPHPDEWDPRVLELVDHVERLRGHRFDHPVYIDFLTAEEYTAAATSPEEELTDDGRLELDRLAGELRALGVASGEMDLFTAFNQVVDGGTLAFYDTVTERVKVRGTEMTVALEVTLVHELTHALQDQVFDLGRMSSGDLDSAESLALRGLVEGDARRIEQRFVSEILSEEEHRAYQDETSRQLSESQGRTEAVPGFLSASFGMTYVLGEPFVTMLTNRGEEAIDRAFRDPPTTDEHLFDPASYLAGEGAEEIDLDLGDLDVLDTSTLGTTGWYLILAERMDPKTALAATLGWAGDGYATFEREGRMCVRAAFSADGDDPAEEEAVMRVALQEWARAMPGGRARAMDVDGHPGFESCDPGSDVDMALADRALESLRVPALWGHLIADAARVFDPPAARCYASGVIESLSYDDIVTGRAFGTEAFGETLNRAYERCL